MYDFLSIMMCSIGFWDSFDAEKLNLKCCRIFYLSIVKTAAQQVSKSLCQCLNFKLFLQYQVLPNSLVSDAMYEMSLMSDSGHDCWLTWVRKMETLHVRLCLPARTLPFSHLPPKLPKNNQGPPNLKLPSGLSKVPLQPKKVSQRQKEEHWPCESTPWPT